MIRLIFGCGYLGARVARRWLDADDSVHVVTRSRRRADELQRAGYRPIVADVTDPASLTGVPTADTVLLSVGFDRMSGHSIERIYVDGMKNVLAALPSQTDRVIYTSSTGVYGQADGRWVDEQSPCEPSRAGGRACLAAEQLLADHPLGQRGVVLRLGGLYGPGRAALLDQVRTGQPLPVSPDGLLNLIHVDDAAATVVAAAERADPPATYCVTDGHPVTRADYYAEIARRLGAPPPRFAPPSSAQSTRSEPPDAQAGAAAPASHGQSAGKRVRNDKLLRDLGVELEFADYRKGLAAAFAADSP